MHILDVDEWFSRSRVHARAASERTASREQRMRRGEPNAMEDFLYEYYPLRPKRFAAWHPGIDSSGPIGLARPSHSGSALTWWAERTEHRWYTVTDDVLHLSNDYFGHRAKGLAFQARLQRSLLDRTASFGCLGWHEWAMVYRSGDKRHPLPLRLGQAETDRLVEQAKIRCTHFDAFQFFTDPAVPLNEVQPSYDTVEKFEQPGCIHVSMDLLRVCIQFQPMIPGELSIEAFDLARRARRVDMAASPYDSSVLGIEPIAIETAGGKAAYIAHQQAIADDARALRERIAPLLEEARERSQLKVEDDMGNI